VAAWISFCPSAEAGWRRCWCVLGRDLLECFEDDSRLVLLTKVGISADSEAYGRASLPDHWAAAAGLLEGRDFGFAFSPDGSPPAAQCFDAEDVASRDQWLAALSDASMARPERLEAYIDDFSDFEDDEHARRSSIADAEGVDWARLEVCSRSSRRNLSTPSQASTGEDSVAALSDSDVAARRLTTSVEALDNTTLLEAEHDFDWTKVGQDWEVHEAVRQVEATERVDQTAAVLDEAAAEKNNDVGSVRGAIAVLLAEPAGASGNEQFDDIECW